MYRGRYSEGRCSLRLRGPIAMKGDPYGWRGGPQRCGAKASLLREVLHCLWGKRNTAEGKQQIAKRSTDRITTKRASNHINNPCYCCHCCSRSFWCCSLQRPPQPKSCLPGVLWAAAGAAVAADAAAGEGYNVSYYCRCCYCPHVPSAAADAGLFTPWCCCCCCSLRLPNL